MIYAIIRRPLSPYLHTPLSFKPAQPASPHRCFAKGSQASIFGLVLRKDQLRLDGDGLLASWVTYVLYDLYAPLVAVQLGMW